MKNLIFLSIVALVSLTSAHSQPVLGVVTQTLITLPFIQDPLVAASMSFGARIVPLKFDLPDDQLQSEMRQLNGVLFPGGIMELCSREGEMTYWTRQVKKIYDFALQLNDEGTYFPIWGSCQGLEVLSIIVAEDCSVLGVSNAQDYPSTVQYLPTAGTSRLLGDFDPVVLQLSGQEKFTLNNHGYGISVGTIQENPKLTSFFSLLATAFDSEGIEQVAIVEGKHYPVYATMFHPEEATVYYQEPAHYLRPVEAIEFNQSFFRFFVG